MKKIKSKNFKALSIAFLILCIIYVGTRYIAKSILSVNKVCHQNTCFIVEVADDEDSRKQGLMYREKLAKNKGMIFIFEEEKRYSFWMKNTLIPLDMIRINSDFEIVDIKTAQPCYTQVCGNYVPMGDAMYVLEINAGLAEEYGIQIKDILEIKIKNG